MYYAIYKVVLQSALEERMRIKFWGFVLIYFVIPIIWHDVIVT